MILSTHILPEVEATCSRVLIINEGVIVASGTPEELQAAAGGEDVIRVCINTGGDPADVGLPEGPSSGYLAVMEAISEIDGVNSLAKIGEVGGGYVRYAAKVRGGSDVAETIFRIAVERGWTINELKRETLSLEDVFLKLTTREIAR